MLYPLSYGGSDADVRHERAAAPTVVRSHAAHVLTGLRLRTPCTSGDPKA
jgi:hypothetical protein